MALNTPVLKEDIKTIATEMRTRTEISDDEFAERLSIAIERFVKSASIIYVNGLTAPNGPVTGTFAGNLE
ncbi:hypothetical protein Q765_00190 [Flavobacterium rivuli WB 3.3-2 = DSM 21788]|uniref:Uncharacterized protein n=1 Tax=Flavobacterium rivuli WB 3.3-2 = DSM 21788 TaxID=1121895 RepID=A0A0A2MJ70_9FLAO|nr:hypothetical protein [Flavobacterium rivuli]KGO88375.1 hypothetical protein Q765_00190 [Flavobacterium rivuli WB 3.3-2 = DSM 21788]